MIASDGAQAAANISTLIDDDLKRLHGLSIGSVLLSQKENGLSVMLVFLSYFSTWPNAICINL